MISLYHSVVNIPALLLKQTQRVATFDNQGRDIHKGVIRGGVDSEMYKFEILNMNERKQEF